MITINDDLKKACEDAGFTMADMALWCDCDKAAMREWLRNDVTPHPIKQKHLEKRIQLVREVLDNPGDKLPVPIQIKQYDRKDYVLQVRDHALKTISKRGSTGRRV